MCQRNLRLPVALIAVGGVLFFALIGGLLWGSGRIKNRLERRQLSSEDVLKATQSLVAGNPAVHNPVGFSGIDQTTVGHWDGRRWRASGYVDTRPQPGITVRTLYFAVLLRERQDLEPGRPAVAEYGIRIGFRQPQELTVAG
jgi:hypothetical protein